MLKRFPSSGIRRWQSAVARTAVPLATSYGSSSFNVGRRFCATSAFDSGVSPTAEQSNRRVEDVSALWNSFYGNENGDAPQWFEQLCRDLHFRTDAETDGFDQEARDSPVVLADEEATPVTGHFFHLPREGGEEHANPRRVPAARSAAARVNTDELESGAVDPYLYLGFNVLPENEYDVGRYEFESLADAIPSFTEQSKLCLGDRERQYVHFADAYLFPDRTQLPTSVGQHPARLLVDPSAAVPTVFIQLAPEMPPITWLPVKPTAAAVRRVLAEFASLAAFHRDSHHPAFEASLLKSQYHLQQQNVPNITESKLLRQVAKLARDMPLQEAPINEFPNHQTLFFGEHADPEKFLEYIDNCPYLFAIPHLRTEVNLFNPEHTPTISGPGVATSLYRCVYSKALIQVDVHLGCEVKLPPQDQDAFNQLWSDVEGASVPSSRVPIFVKVVWPDNKRMSGGGGVIARFNDICRREFAHNMPVDAAMALHFLSVWAERQSDLLGIRGLRTRLAELEAEFQNPPSGEAATTANYPGTRDIPNPEYRADEKIAMHVQYLARLGDPEAGSTIVRLLGTGTAAIRAGCAKAALELGEMALFRRIVSSEPAGRMQHYLTTLVRKRKKRDLTDDVPRLLDDQYEFAAPLWTGRGRLDPATFEGRIDLRRLRDTGRVK